MHPLIPASAHLCILEYRPSVLPAEPVNRDSTPAYPEGGRLLFDLNLSLPAGSGTWFDLVHGVYFIDITPQGNAPIVVQPVPDLAGAQETLPKGFVRLSAQTRLAIRNSGQDESATVSVKILRFAQ
ncbi:MAG: hypothetical protein LUQ40_04070 [Methanomicrobiales archaeon]|nr:hypothetical protein [Methanomicrobiales archaeon]